MSCQIGGPSSFPLNGKTKTSTRRTIKSAVCVVKWYRHDRNENDNRWNWTKEHYCSIRIKYDWKRGRFCGFIESKHREIRVGNRRWTWRKSPNPRLRIHIRTSQNRVWTGCRRFIVVIIIYLYSRSDPKPRGIKKGILRHKLSIEHTLGSSMSLLLPLKTLFTPVPERVTWRGLRWPSGNILGFLDSSVQHLYEGFGLR